jgi:hypothetical protein
MSYINQIKAGLISFFRQFSSIFRVFAGKPAGYLLFLILPLIYLVVVTLAHYSLSPFSLSRVDPEYFYMYNGVILGAGNLSIQYFAHPGTPLHFLIAVSSRIVDLFQNGDYMQNFVNDPEKYIHAANLLLNSIITIILFTSGVLIRRYSGSILAGLLIQLVPFSNMEIIMLSARLFPEAMLIIPILLTCVLLVRYIYKGDDGFNYEIFFGLVIGFGIAIKLTFIPVAILPLVLMNRPAKKKALSLLFTLLFFMIFAYPIVFNYNLFWDWTSGIFSHSGKYGSGSKGIINMAEVPGHFVELYRSNNFLLITVLIGLILALAGLISKPGNDSVSRKSMRAVLAVAVTVITAVLFTLKHFSLYYFHPYKAYLFPLILLIAILVLNFRGISYSKVFKISSSIIFSGIVIFLLTGQVKQTRYGLKNNTIKSEIARQERDHILSLVDPAKPMVISGQYFGAPFIEYAHFSGLVMCGKLQKFYFAYLKEKFPDRHFFIGWSDKFHSWGDFTDFGDILRQTKSSFYIYTGKERGNDLKIIEDRMLKFISKDSVNEKILFQDTKTGESLVEVFLVKNKNNE